MIELMETKTSEENVFAALFGHNPAISLDERARVIAELEKIGSLTFDVKKDSDGWTAQCKEVSGIVAGGINPNPSEVEIETQIRSAIFAAFNVKEQEVDKKSPYFAIRDFGHTENSVSEEQTRR